MAIPEFLSFSSSPHLVIFNSAMSGVVRNSVWKELKGEDTVACQVLFEQVGD